MHLRSVSIFSLFLFSANMLAAKQLRKHARVYFIIFLVFCIYVVVVVVFSFLFFFFLFIYAMMMLENISIHIFK